MNILITGGFGYIGSHLCIELLNLDINIIVIDNLSNSNTTVIQKIETLTNKKFIYYLYDLLDKNKLEDIFRNHTIDTVIHMAGYKSVNDSIQQPIVYYQNNIISTIHLLETMQKYKCFQLIFSSSSTVYGNNKSPFTEKDSIGINISNPYGKTKYMIEEILMDLSISNPLWKIVSLRYFNPVGNHASGILGDDSPKPTNLMPILVNVGIKNNINSKLDSNYNQLHIYGNDYHTNDGTPERDFIHVIDLVLGHIAVLNKIKQLNHYNSYNLGTGKAISVLEMVNTFSRVNNINIPYKIVDRRPGDIASSYCITNKSQLELQWETHYNLEDMCRDSWKFGLDLYKE